MRLLFLAAFTLTACNSVHIKDSAWYADEGELGAAEFHLLKPGQRDISKSEWDKMRFGMACSELSNLIELKGVIEKLCGQTNSCTFEQLQVLQNLTTNLNVAKEKINDVQE